MQSVMSTRERRSGGFRQKDTKDTRNTKDTKINPDKTGRTPQDPFAGSRWLAQLMCVNGRAPCAGVACSLVQASRSCQSQSVFCSALSLVASVAFVSFVSFVFHR